MSDDVKCDTCNHEAWQHEVPCVGCMTPYEAQLYVSDPRCRVLEATLLRKALAGAQERARQDEAYRERRVAEFDALEQERDEARTEVAGLEQIIAEYGIRIDDLDRTLRTAGTPYSDEIDTINSLTLELDKARADYDLTLRLCREENVLIAEERGEARAEVELWKGASNDTERQRIAEWYARKHCTEKGTALMAVGLTCYEANGVRKCRHCCDAGRIASGWFAEPREEGGGE